MYKFMLLFQLIILKTALLALAIPDPKDDPIYRPISSRNYEAALGIKRRAEETFSDLEPKTRAELVYGRHGEDEKLLLAHMKLHASNGLNIVLMEHFDHLTRSVDCNGLDGLMSLSFKSRDAFSRALEAWSFINEDEDTNFLLIADHENCSPSNQRQPYIISNVREDPSKLTTFLTAREAPWSEVASDFEMEFGHVMPKKKSLSTRGIISFLRTGNADFERGVTAKLEAGTPGKVFTVINGGVLSKSNKVDCVDCYMLGTLLVSGHVKVRGFKLEALVLNASPQDLTASLKFEVTVDKPTTIESHTYEKKLVNVPVPEAGIIVKNIFELGLRVQYVAGWTTKLKDGAVFNIGAVAKIPGTAKISVDAVDYSKSTASGFDDASIDPIFELISVGRNGLDFSIATKPKLIFGIDIVKIGHLDLTLSFNLPEVKNTLIPTFGPKGACSEKPGASKTGVKVQSKIDLELDLKIDGQLGDAEKPSQLWEAKLWNKDKDFYKKCFPLHISGLLDKIHPASKPPSSKPAQLKPIPSGVITKPYPTGGMPLVPSSGFRSPYPLRPVPSGAAQNPEPPREGPVPSGAVRNSPYPPKGSVPSGAVRNSPYPPKAPVPSGATQNPRPPREGPVPSGAAHNLRPPPKDPVPSGAIQNPPHLNTPPQPEQPVPNPKAPVPNPKKPIQNPHAPGAKLYPIADSPPSPAPSTGFAKRGPYPMPRGWMGLYGVI